MSLLNWIAKPELLKLLRSLLELQPELHLFQRPGLSSGIWCFLGECFPRPALEAALHALPLSVPSHQLVDADLVWVRQRPPCVEQACAVPASPLRDRG